MKYFEMIKKKLANCHINIINNSEKRELDHLKNENLSLKNLVETYEERNLNIFEIEKKIKFQQSKYKNELKEIQEKYEDVNILYKQKIKKYKKKIKQYELYFNKSNSKEKKIFYPQTERVLLY